MPLRTATARWNGTLTDGNGTMRLSSRAFEGPYSYGSRFEEGTGTNPEELIAAAHAGCFSMALSGNLQRAGHTAESVDTEARVRLDKHDDGFAITRIDLVTRARVPGVDEHTFRKAAEDAKQGCPVSQALKAVEIHLDAQLEA